MSETSQELKDILLQLGQIRPQAEVIPLTGGVSSDIVLVRDGSESFVVKRALAKLKVAADWRADTSRNTSEQAYMRYVASFRVDAMPKILWANEEAGLFAMEFLDGFENWKSVLLHGQCATSLARQAGQLLGDIHQRSWGDQALQIQFDNLANFDQLRIDPYLRAAARVHPTLEAIITAEAQRLTQSQECLIHGDYSPKNILFQGERIVPLDCEVACFADAAFDLSFFLNHLFLKSLYHSPNMLPFSEMIDAARDGYAAGNPEHADRVEGRTSHLLPMLLLARVDGKSPVEYLDEAKQQFVREFVEKWLTESQGDLSLLQSQWFQKLNPQ